MSPRTTGSQKVQASDDGPAASKRMRRGEEGKHSRPSFLDAKTMVKINVSDRAGEGAAVDDQESQGPMEAFLVHKAFICQYSPFFDAAFNGNFEEGTTQELDLPDTDPVAFSILVDWLYTQTTMQLPADLKIPAEHLVLAKLWILAERTLIPRLQNETLAILDERRSSTGRLGHSSNSCFYVYENTTDGSPLRRYFSYMAARRLENMDNDVLPTDMFGFWPRDMLIDIIEELRNPTGKVGSEARLPEEQLQKFYVSEQHKNASAGVATT